MNLVNIMNFRMSAMDGTQRIFSPLKSKKVKIALLMFPMKIHGPGVKTSGQIVQARIAILRQPLLA